MAPATVPQTTTPRKPATAFYAHLHGIAGALAQVEGQILFFAWDSGAITPVTSYAGLTVLGDMGLADTQRLMDALRGGLVALCTSRAN
jgi:hypothetical protein